MKFTRNAVFVLAASMLSVATPALADDTTAAAETTATIAEAAAQTGEFATLTAALKAAGVDAKLAEAGPFTVFAPDNAAFERLAPGTMETLNKPENKPTLTKILTYHVVPGALSLETLVKQAKGAGGSTTLTTVEGGAITLTAEESGAIKLTDANGNASYVAKPDLKQTNGVIHGVNGVLLPKLS